MKDNLCVLDIQVKGCQVIINILPTGEFINVQYDLLPLYFLGYTV